MSNHSAAEQQHPDTATGMRGLADSLSPQPDVYLGEPRRGPFLDELAFVCSAALLQCSSGPVAHRLARKQNRRTRQC